VRASGAACCAAPARAKSFGDDFDFHLYLFLLFEALHRVY
jgi:hypothetical protein